MFSKYLAEIRLRCDIIWKHTVLILLILLLTFYFCYTKEYTFMQ